MTTKFCDPSPNGTTSSFEIAYSATDLSPGFCPLSILAANDARGRPTLRLSNDRHYYVKGGYEQMWDVTDRRFLSEADGWAIPHCGGMGIASRDLNSDGLDEVMLTSMGDQLLQIATSDGRYEAADYSIGRILNVRTLAMMAGLQPAGMRNLAMSIMMAAPICSLPKEMWIKCRGWRCETPIIY